MAPSIARFHPDRIRRAEWSGADVTIAQVVAELQRLQAGLARHGAGDFEHPHPRNSVMNLITVAHDDAEAERAAAVGEELGGKHPSRTVIVQLAVDGPDRIDAAVRTHAHELMAGAPVQYQEVRLKVAGSPARHLASVLEPLLEADVRTHLWWLGTPPWEDEAFGQLLEAVDTLVVDSATFDRPFDSLLALARLAESLPAPRGVADFHWGRHHAWRESMAQFFAPASRRPFLDGINALGLDYSGEGRGNRGAAGMLAGWLIEALGWRLRSAAAGQGGYVLAYYESAAGHPVEVVMRSVPAPGIQPGEVLAMRIDSVAHSQTCRVQLVREPEAPDHARMSAQIGSDEPIEHEMLLLATDEAGLLSELLVSERRDPVYLRSLKAAAGLLSAFK